MKTAASFIVELLGLAAIVFGVYLFDWRAAVLIGGLLLVLVGYVLDVPTGPKKRPEQ